jgi:peptidoglycan/LPS O-acetylase OafA/YrhL
MSIMKLSVLGNNKRIYGLDILRAFAILSVVYEHGYRLLNPAIISWDYYDFFVFDGVSIFFVLSGYLIGQILIDLFQDNEKISMKHIYNFWIRRWCRTLPNYFLVLSILGATFFCLKSIRLVSIVPYYLFAQNIYYPISWFFPESWSLSVEEWFYILVPLLIFICVSIFSIKNKNSLLFSAFTVILFATGYRFFYSYSHIDTSFHFWDHNYRKEVITRLDSIMYGVLGAFVFVFYKEWWQKYDKAFFSVGVCILIISKYFLGFTSNLLYNNVFSFSLISIGTLFLIPLLSTIKYGKGVVYNFITFISIISYSMYLINLFLVQSLLLPFTFKILGMDIHNSTYWTIKYSLYIFYTILGSYLLFIFWERPTTALREKLVIK